MTPHAPGPTIIQVQYSTPFGFHNMRMYTRHWNPASTGHDLGEVGRWSDDTLIDLETMVNDMVTLFLPFYKADCSFDLATVFTQAAPGDPLIPVASKALTGMVGTDVTTCQRKAVQLTTSMRTVGNNIAKSVLLDCQSFNNFDPVRTVGAAPDIDLIVAEFADVTNAWSGKDDTRISTFIGAFKTLNEALRKAYRQT